MTATRRSFVISVALLALFTTGAVLIAASRGGTALGSGNPHGDVDCDGDVDSVDAVRIPQQDANLFPLPSGCGKDPVPTAVPPATPTPTLDSSRDNPLPRGQSLVVPEGWEITITDFVSDATDLVLDENQFNDPPEAGRKYSIVRVRLTNVAAEDPDNHVAGFALRLVGSENVAYTTFTDSCGVIPDDIDFGPSEVFRGGTVEGNVCYQVGVDEGDFILFSSYSFDDANRRWFAVD